MSNVAEIEKFEKRLQRLKEDKQVLDAQMGGPASDEDHAHMDAWIAEVEATLKRLKGA